MDGTLVRGTTALAHLGAWIGHEANIDGLEARLARGEISDREVAEDHARFYRGVALADAVEAMSGIASIDDIAIGVEMLRQRSVEVLIATVSWSFAARGLADLWGFSDVCGADLELDQASGVFTGRVARHFAPEDKAAFVAEHCRRLGIAMEQVVAIGDSRSDLPLFQAVGFSVALNATSDARAAASTSVEGPSFLTALRAVPGLLP
jgi:phosphoserine phosphatase